MSSKGGPRAKGTDGGDFGHREKVASHYQISSSNKRKLKIAIGFHFLCLIFILLKSAPKILQFFEISLKQYVNVSLPAPALWELVWLSSAVFIPFALYATRKNYPTIMQIYAIGTFVTGISPLVFGIIYHSSDFKMFVVSDTGSVKVEKFYGVPIVLITSVFITVTFLIHSLSIMTAMNLVKAWTPKSGKKKS
ncbi:protein jagunal [Parasteatoda tepidariorum]|uniref:BLTX780 n=1 Tax=Parasteatoda tepidariorum TaxID=114398 RepID=A0A2L2Y4Z1_PARTP|nr:protein jagunal [Parasteatoda tepidariorum]